jgi:hypothetical protein
MYEAAAGATLSRMRDDDQTPVTAVVNGHQDVLKTEDVAQVFLHELAQIIEVTNEASPQ